MAHDTPDPEAGATDTASGLVRPWYDIGDVAPSIPLQDEQGRGRPITRLAGAAGIFHVLSPRDETAEGGLAVVQAFAQSAERFEAIGAKPRIVRRASPVRNLAFGKKHNLGLEVLADEKGALAHNLHLGEGSVTVIFDRISRLAAVIPADGSAQAHVDAVLEAATGIAPPLDMQVGGPVQAPVMLVPDVLPPELRAHLIATYRAHNAPSGFMEKQGSDMVLKFDEDVKRRRDHVVATGSPLEQELRHVFQRRVIPEITRSTHCTLQGHEDFKIVRYSEEEQGFFKAHRDNTAPGSAGRKFAVTLNLNTGAYNGGHLVFPEYGNLGYLPRAGEAVVFSCALLHEARPVTRGERFALLTFLY